jgi:F-type H+-transporting ATPase subunit alpha
MDDVAVDRIKDYQAGLMDFLGTRKADLLKQIIKQGALNDALTAELKTAADQFKGTWK